MINSIIGSGAVGLALASQFARSRISVGVANSRGRDAVAPLVKELGASVHPMSLNEASRADTIFLAVPFWAHRDVAKAMATWQGKIVVDVTNAYGVPLADLDNRPSSTVVAQAFTGAHIVKAFNHLPALALAQEPGNAEGRRAIFLSGDDEGAVGDIALLVRQLGYAPVNLGRISEGGQLVQARDTSWAPLIFQDLFKKEN